MKRLLILFVLLVFLCGLTMLQAEQLRTRPLLVKLGAPPDGQAISLVAGAQKPLLSWWWVTRVMVYFGSLVEPDARKMRVPPEYYNMYKTIEAAIRLDPYNMDAYYFAQAAFTWDIGRIKEVNALLLHGMKYRDWDYQLPFYAGFNAAYFLKDYKEGARLMRLAAERSDNILLTNLAARYFHQARQTDLGIAFLELVMKKTRDQNLLDVYRIRLAALHAARVIEVAVADYLEQTGHPPETLAVLLSTGLLDRIPEDPYGGTFYLEADGSVKSTSKFAFKSVEEPKSK